MRGLLGEGAFGAVYLARAVGGGIQREVAIKVLHRERATNPALVGRLRDEARMLALIRHRAIVRVDDLIELDGDWSIVMEYVEGCDLAAILRAGAVAPAIALAVAEEVANALHAAWNQPGLDGKPLRLIHRDIKPGNVRLTAQGEVKLLDFGVARAEFAEREAGTTQTGFGTLTYMAAERFEGKDSHQGDVYALGVFLFEMLTGVTPGKTAADRDRQPPGRRYAEQWAYIAGVSKDLQSLLAGMLSYEPAQRPVARDAARALADIRQDLRGERLEDWAARTVPALLVQGGIAPREGARTGTILTERSGPPRAPERPAARVLPWLAGGVASVFAFVVVVLLAGAGTWWVMRGPGAPVQPPPQPESAATPASVAGAAGNTSSAQAASPAPAPAPGTRAPSAGATPASGSTGPSAKSSVSAARPTKPLSSSGTTPTAPVNVATPAPPPPPPIESPTGRLRLAGDLVKATFVGPNGAVSAGVVAPGTYVAEVRFDGDMTPVTIRNIVVNAGRVTFLTCKADFRNCVSTQE